MADIIQNLDNLGDEALEYLARTPVATPPLGVKSDFDHPPSRTALQTWTLSVFLAIAITLYLNRLYVKARLMRTWNWDDVTLAVTVLLAIAQYSFMTRGVTQSIMGRHLWDISVVQLVYSRLAPTAYAIMVLTPLNLLFLKITFFLLYLQLFSRIRWVRITSLLGICYVVLSMGTVAIYAFAVANPHENISWGGKATRLGLPVGILSLVADIVIFVIPFAAIIPLQISHAKRIGALLLFLTGGSAIICAILNIYYRCKLQRSSDPLWDGVLGSMSSLCEVLLGITCACLPSAAYGFRQKGTFYHKALHPSLYLNSKQSSSAMLSSSAQHRSRAADLESVSRSRIRRTTYVEISTAQRENDLIEARPSLVDEERMEKLAESEVELTALEPAHLISSNTVQRRI